MNMLPCADLTQVVLAVRRTHADGVRACCVTPLQWMTVSTEMRAARVRPVATVHACTASRDDPDYLRWNGDACASYRRIKVTRPVISWIS